MTTRYYYITSTVYLTLLLDDDDIALHHLSVLLYIYNMITSSVLCQFHPPKNIKFNAFFTLFDGSDASVRCPPEPVNLGPLCFHASFQTHRQFCPLAALVCIAVTWGRERNQDSVCVR